MQAVQSLNIQAIVFKESTIQTFQQTCHQEKTVMSAVKRLEYLPVVLKSLIKARNTQGEGWNLS